MSELSVNFEDIYTLPSSTGELDVHDHYLLQLRLVVDLTFAADQLDEPNIAMWVRHARQSLVSLMVEGGEEVNTKSVVDNFNNGLSTALIEYAEDFDLTEAETLRLVSTLPFMLAAENMEAVTNAA